MKAHINTPFTLPSSIIAIGAFDGVHQGHQAVIKQTIERSKAMGIPSVIYTFDPPPRVYFQGAHLLTPLEEKLTRLEKLGVDYVKVVSFNQIYAKRSAINFINSLKDLNPMEIMVGDDFRFGYQRKGDISLLQTYFTVRITSPVFCQSGNLISSSRIRQLISQGELHHSSLLLGWPN